MNEKKIDHLKEIKEDFFKLVDINPIEFNLRYYGDEEQEGKESDIWAYGSKLEDMIEIIFQLIDDAKRASKGKGEKAKWYLGVAEGLEAMLELYFSEGADRLKSLEKEIALVKNPQGTN